MPEEKRVLSRHAVVLERRESAAISGVLDVISFDDENVVVETEMGVLVLRGTNLHVSRLSLEKGELDVDGELISLHYEEQNTFSKGKSGSLLGKLLK